MASIHQNDFIVIGRLQNQLKQRGRQRLGRYLYNHYRPTENLTIKNFQFRSFVQGKNESFNAFCNRLDHEIKHCQFKCENGNCTAEDTALRDQVIIGTSKDSIREEALKKAWDLQTLRTEGMRVESAYKGAAEIAGKEAINKLGKYSYKHMKTLENTKPKEGRGKILNCYHCGSPISGMSITKHVGQCPAKRSQCRNCGKLGHYSEVCKNKFVSKEVFEANVNREGEDELESIYNINVFQIRGRVIIATMILMSNC